MIEDKKVVVIRKIENGYILANNSVQWLAKDLSEIHFVLLKLFPLEIICDLPDQPSPRLFNDTSQWLCKRLKDIIDSSISRNEIVDELKAILKIVSDEKKEDSEKTEPSETPDTIIKNLQEKIVTLNGEATLLVNSLSDVVMRIKEIRKMTTEADSAAVCRWIGIEANSLREDLEYLIFKFSS